jgi:predicted DNA-binding transcriptional regulator AlpA
MSEEKLLLSASEAGEYIGCTISDIFSWSDSGKMPGPINIDKREFWRRKDIEEWVNNGCKEIKNDC